MGDDRPVSLAVLRSVIESYHKKRESLEQREAQVQKRLQALRARSPSRVESYEINIETRESIVRSTAEVTPTNSYLPAHGAEPSDLLFHAQYSQYRNSEQSVDALSAQEISEVCVATPPRGRSARRPSFSYQERGSDSEGRKGRDLTARRPRKSRPDRHSVRARVRDQSASQVDVGRGRSPRHTGHVAEKLALVAAQRTLKRGATGESEAKHRVQARYDQQTVASTQSAKRHTSREASRRAAEQIKKYPKLQEIMSEYRAPYSQGAQVPVRVPKKSPQPREFPARTVLNAQVGHRSRPIKKRSLSDSEVGRGSDSSNSLVEERGRLRDVVRSLPRPTAHRTTPHSMQGETRPGTPECRDTAKALAYPPTSGYTYPHSMQGETHSMGSRPGTPECRDTAKAPTSGYTHPHSMLGETHSISSRPGTPQRRDVAYPTCSGYTHPHPIIGETHSMGSRPSTPQRRDMAKAVAYPTTSGYTHPHATLGEAHSMMNRPATPGTVERRDVRPRSQPSPDRTVVRRSPMSGFDEAYSNNFLIFLIRKSLPRAMTSILLPTNGFSDKTSREVANYVEEIETIKKLICDELDRRESIGKPFKILRKEKELMMKNFMYAKVVSDRLRQGLPVQEAVTNLHDHDSQSAMRLQARTVQALRQARHLLGGGLPDPEQADDLQSAAQQCLDKLNSMHCPAQPPRARLNTSCQSCQQNWVTEEVNRLKDALVNIEQHLPGEGPALAYQSRGFQQQQQRVTSDDTIRIGAVTQPQALAAALDCPYHRGSDYPGSVRKLPQAHRQR